MITQQVLLILEILGTIAFAVSGALVAIKARFDVFGVIVVGCVTAVGGGITRDVIAGSLPPLIFSNLHIILIAALTSLLVFIVAYVKRNAFESIRERVDCINNYFDAVGLAAFSVMGVELAFQYGLSGNVILSITMGVLTGVGGGLLRDMFTETPPYIFTKHVYAIASIIGATAYYVLRLYVDNILATVVGIILIVLLRVLATKFHWSLPKVHIEEKK